MRMSKGVVALLLFFAVAPLSAEEHGYRVIVNRTNPLTTVDRPFIAEAFLKKTTRWPNGETIHPVDLAADAPERARFSSEVLGRTVAAVKNYWQQAIFSGRDVPPLELGTSEEVINYVVKHSGAIGYVAAGADLAAVKVVTVNAR